MSKGAGLILAAFSMLVGLVLIGPVLAAILGGIAGWVVGWAIPSVVNSLNEISGQDMSGWTWGAMLGFVGAFLRSTHVGNKD